MTIFQKITKSQVWEDHKNSIFFLFFFVLLSSFLPVWITLFVMLLTGSWQNVADLWNNGGFFIYSATLWGSAIYMMHGYPKKNSVSLISALYVASWFFIVFSAVGFTIATIPSVLSSQFTVDSGALATTSFIFIALSLSTIYYAHYYDLRKPDTDRKSRESVQSLMDKIS